MSFSVNMFVCVCKLFLYPWYTKDIGVYDLVYSVNMFVCL